MKLKIPGVTTFDAERVSVVTDSGHELVITPGDSMRIYQATGYCAVQITRRDPGAITIVPRNYKTIEIEVG